MDLFLWVFFIYMQVLSYNSCEQQNTDDVGKANVSELDRILKYSLLFPVLTKYPILFSFCLTFLSLPLGHKAFSKSTYPKHFLADDSAFIHKKPLSNHVLRYFISHHLFSRPCVRSAWSQCPIKSFPTSVCKQVIAKMGCNIRMRCNIRMSYIS